VEGGEEAKDLVLIFVDEVDDEMLLLDIDGDNPGTPPSDDPLLITLLVVGVMWCPEEVLLIGGFDGLLSLDADERNDSISSSVIGDVGSGGSGPAGGNVRGGFEKVEEVEGDEDSWLGMHRVCSECCMKEGGAGDDFGSSGIGGLRAHGAGVGRWMEGDELGGGMNGCSDTCNHTYFSHGH